MEGAIDYTLRSGFLPSQEQGRGTLAVGRWRRKSAIMGVVSREGCLVWGMEGWQSSRGRDGVVAGAIDCGLRSGFVPTQEQGKGLKGGAGLVECGEGWN